MHGSSFVCYHLSGMNASAHSYMSYTFMPAFSAASFDFCLAYALRELSRMMFSILLSAISFSVGSLLPPHSHAAFMVRPLISFPFEAALSFSISSWPMLDRVESGIFVLFMPLSTTHFLSPRSPQKSSP